nr:hypothetical protein GCM10020185_37630 [Pseudomonas brassicacearum subsp. brassicacearum]
MKVEAPTNAHIAANLAQAVSAVVGIGTPVESFQAVQSNSMEEVGMTFSHHVERNTKALSQRRIRNARSEVGQTRVETREQLEEWYDQLGHPGKQSLGGQWPPRLVCCCVASQCLKRWCSPPVVTRPVPT